MDRRRFIAVSATGLLSMTLGDELARLSAKSLRNEKEYSIVILGDTHYDTEPASVYHSNYNEKVEWLNRVQRAEFARNGEMWRERCPRMVRRASRLITPDTKMVFQMGDLVQGDCGNGEVHQKMLSDAIDLFKKELGGLPFAVVVGNHDIRGVDAKAVCHRYLPQRMSEELGKEIRKTTFSFNIGADAYIFIDFNDPDDAEVEKLLKDTEGARHTFVVVHGPLLPFDAASCRWFYHGGASPEQTALRRHFRELFAKRNVICLCGHVHTTEFADWYGDGGRITQMTMNSVWANEEIGKYKVVCEGAAQYGERRKTIAQNANGSKLTDETPLFDEYRPGLKRYSVSPAAGSYKMRVSKKHIYVDFYAGDSLNISHTFKLR
ncbi:MAG: metallophosphoesterase [Prevotella sp.]|nr:metallophosphoesterase [Prevotella sp.]